MFLSALNRIWGRELSETRQLIYTETGGTYWEENNLFQRVDDLKKNQTMHPDSKASKLISRRGGVAEAEA
jgi:hypothetical protein